MQMSVCACVYDVCVCVYVCVQQRVSLCVYACTLVQCKNKIAVINFTF